LYESYVSLFNGNQNVTCTSCHRAMKMWLYNWGCQRPKSKDPRTLMFKPMSKLMHARWE
jgi:hypothetical protein